MICKCGARRFPPVLFFSSEEISATILLRDVINIFGGRSQPISEVDSWDSNQGQIQLKSIGLAYYPFLTDLKHSCDPNTLRFEIDSGWTSWFE